jgi:hypothetical protein
LLLVCVTNLPLCASAKPASAEAKNVVTRGSVRLKILSPSVVRMEYSRDRRFVDVPSVAVENRNWGATEFHAADSGSWLAQPAK